MVKNCIGTKCQRYEKQSYGSGCLIPPQPGYTSEWVSLEVLGKCPGPVVGMVKQI